MVDIFNQLPLADDESKHGESESWQKRTAYVSRQTDETVQEYDSAYSSDSKPRGSTYGKEPSYVEDSLLQSMFGEGDNIPEVDSTSSTPISIARYVVAAESRAVWRRRVNRLALQVFSRASHYGRHAERIHPCF